MLTQPIPLCRHFVATDSLRLHNEAWRPRQKLCQPEGLCRSLLFLPEFHCCADTPLHASTLSAWLGGFEMTRNVVSVLDLFFTSCGTPAGTCMPWC